jgi:hypothetical protein
MIWPLSHNPRKPYDRKAALQEQRERFNRSVVALNELKAKYPGCGGATISGSAEARWMTAADKKEGRV